VIALSCDEPQKKRSTPVPTITWSSRLSSMVVSIGETAVPLAPTEFLRLYALSFLRAKKLAPTSHSITEPLTLRSHASEKLRRNALSSRIVKAVRKFLD
jgi:hypothetical protein